MKFHRSSAVIAALVAALAWGVKAPFLLEMMRAGQISPMAFMWYVAATVAIVAGGLRVGFGKSGRLSLFLAHRICLPCKPGDAPGADSQSRVTASISLTIRTTSAPTGTSRTRLFVATT